MYTFHMTILTLMMFALAISLQKIWDAIVKVVNKRANKKANKQREYNEYIGWLHSDPNWIGE